MAFPPITPLPGLPTQPDAISKTWNDTYLEIDALFDLLENVIPGEYWDGNGFSVPPGVGVTNGHVIQDEGIGITQRANLDFIGASVSAADGGSATEITVNGAVLGKNVEALAGNKTLTDAAEPIQVLTPDAARDVNLPAEAVTNPYFLIVNPAGSGFTLTVKDDGGGTITTIIQGETKMIIPDGVTWFVLAGGGGASPLTTKADLYVFSTSDDRLPVGSPGDIITPDPAESTGLKYISVSDLSHNLIKNFPSLEKADGVAPLWWETTNATLTEEDATGEALSAPPNERVLKVVTSAINGLAQQTFLPANERLLSASSTVVSASCWVYVTTAGTVKFSLYDSVGGEIASDTTVVTGSWVRLSVLAEAIGANTLYWRVEHSANAATFHFTNPMLNTGAIVAPFASRGLTVRFSNSSIVASHDPGGAGWTLMDATTATSPQTAMVAVNVVYQNTTTAGKSVSLRRYTDTSGSVFVVTNGNNAAVFWRNVVNIICDDQQRMEYNSSGVLSDVEDLIITAGGSYWEWE